MSRVKEFLNIIRQDGKAIQRIYIVSLVAALMLLAFFLKNSANKEIYIVDKQGNLVGIQRESLSENEKYYVNLTIEDESGTSTREVTINKSAINEKKSSSENSEEISEAEREAEINGIITEIELSKKRKILFPGSLSDGTSLIWSIRKESNNDYVIIPILWLLIVLLVIKGAFDDSKDDMDEYRNEILMNLPRFSNQLLLMMNAGMILSDALHRIAESYRLIPESNRSIFEQEIIEINDNNIDHRRSAANLIADMAAKFNVKELMRIATILTENERRGSDVIDNLSRESSFLWEFRKVQAREKGKMIDTKMAFPLAILLILLIVITMAPTLLSM